MNNRTQEEIIRKWPKDWDVPMVSVRCITYNHESYISQALDSFLMQETDFPFEIVVHDDASTDKTTEILKKYERNFPKIIKPIYQTENQYSKHDGSIARILNEACKGKYIAFCEGDDYWCGSDKLQKQFDFLENNPVCGFCVHKVEMVRADNTSMGKFIPMNVQLSNEYISATFFLKMYASKDSFHLSSFFVRKELYSVFLSENPLFKSVASVGDGPLLLFLATRTNFYYFDNVWSCYRTNSIGSWTQRVLKNSESRLKDRWSHIKMLNAFDDYTHRTYHDILVQGVAAYEFEILQIEHNYREMLSSKYKSIRRRFSWKYNLLLYLGTFSPFLLRLINRFCKVGI